MSSGDKVKVKVGAVKAGEAERATVGHSHEGAALGQPSQTPGGHGRAIPAREGPPWACHPETRLEADLI